MFKNNLDKLRSKMNENDIELSIITDDDNLYYFTGYHDFLHMDFNRPTILLVPKDEQSILITPLLDVLHSISATMFGEYEDIIVRDSQLLRYTHMISHPDEKWNDIMNIWYTDNFKIDNYRQNSILKYTEPDVMSERVLNGIRRHYRNTYRKN